MGGRKREREHKGNRKANWMVPFVNFYASVSLGNNVCAGHVCVCACMCLYLHVCAFVVENALFIFPHFNCTCKPLLLVYLGLDIQKADILLFSIDMSL